MLRRLFKLSAAVTLLAGLLMLGPLAVWATGEVELDRHWRYGSSERVGLAPDPAVTREAVVQVYAARTVGWRGLFAVHPWIAIKPADAEQYQLLEVKRWGLRYRSSAVSISQRMPDHRWYGNAPQLLVELRGAQAGAAIERLYQVLPQYPFADRYGLWPGPNSNTFIAWLARRVPELGLTLPVTAVGKDYLGPTRFFDRTPSGTGFQVSFWGLAGFSLGLQEGLEINLLGTGIGIDILRPAIKWPGLGRIGLPRDIRPDPPRPAPARAPA